MVALRILVAMFLVSVTIWLVIKFAPAVGDFLGKVLYKLLSCNSKKE